MKASDAGRQHGSAEVIIIVVILVAVLGFIAWKVFDAVKPQANNVTKTSESKTDEATPKAETQLVMTFNASLTKQYTLTYPDGWEVAKEKISSDDVGFLNGETADKVMISDPQDNLRAEIFTAIGGLGGACFPEERPSISDLFTEPLKGAPQIVYFDYTDSSGERFTGLGDTTRFKEGKVGGSVCDIQFANILAFADNMSGVVQISSKTTRAANDAAPADYIKAYVAMLKDVNYDKLVTILKSITAK